MRLRLIACAGAWGVRGVLLLMLVFSSWVSARDAAEEYKEQEDEFVYRTILQTIHLERVLTKRNDIKDYGPNTLGMATETGLILLERSHTKGALRWLAELTFVRMDGAVGERHDCAVLSKGKKIIPYLEKSRTRTATETCIPADTKVTAITENVCAPTNDSIRRIEALIRAVRKGEKCEG